MKILSSIESILPILLLISLGFDLQEKKWFGKEFGGNISRLIMNVVLPASIFVSVLKYLTVSKLVEVSSGLLFTFSAVGICYAVAYLAVIVFKVSAGRRGTLINMFANANTIFIGLPLNTALFGQDSISYFLVYYITNTISTWAIGALIIGQDSKDPQKIKQAKFDWKKLLPAPLIGFLVSLVFLFLNIPVPTFATNTLTYLGNIVTPFSLIYIGIVLSKAGLSSIKIDKDTLLALGGRYLVSPIVMWVILLLFGSSLKSVESNTFLIQSAVPGLAVLPILADQANGDVEYATNVVMTSTILFALVMPIMILLIGA
ncbi:TPA: AEC family transporter [Streptococcus suis]